MHQNDDYSSCGATGTLTKVICQNIKTVRERLRNDNSLRVRAVFLLTKW